MWHSKKIKIAIFTLTFVLLVLPFFVMAENKSYEGLVPCTDPNECNYDKLIELAANVVDFMMYKISIPLAALAFSYAGFLLLTSGGDTGKMKKAKTIFTNVAFGFAIVLGAYLFIYTITNSLLKPDYIRLEQP